jgi:hypothetical protein
MFAGTARGAACEMESMKPPATTACFKHIFQLVGDLSGSTGEGHVITSGGAKAMVEKFLACHLGRRPRNSMADGVINRVFPGSRNARRIPEENHIDAATFRGPRHLLEHSDIWMMLIDHEPGVLHCVSTCVHERSIAKCVRFFMSQNRATTIAGKIRLRVCRRLQKRCQRFAKWRPLRRDKATYTTALFEVQKVGGVQIQSTRAFTFALFVHECGFSERNENESPLATVYVRPSTTSSISPSRTYPNSSPSC